MLPNVTDEGFCPVDLADWLALARAAGVPHVPSRIVATAPTSAMLNFDLEDGDHVENLRRFFGDLKAAVAADSGPSMVRWSCCAMSDVKAAVCNGRREWSERFLYLSPDDMRAYDIIGELPRPIVSAHLRPWLALEERTSPAGTFALEARVFVEDGRILGISAYYPQCPLSADDPAVVRLVADARIHAETLVEAQRLPLVVPQLRELHGKRVNSWTVDFAMARDGRVLLLEGGPPSTPTWGAHPCCFEGGPIDGVALEPRYPNG